VDCENVGLNGLTDLVVNTDGSPLKFVLFHNSTNKINLSLTQLKDFGYALSEGRIELVELAIPEKMTKKQAENALDFYIAFYMGQVMPREIAEDAKKLVRYRKADRRKYSKPDRLPPKNGFFGTFEK
jgi:hypothetical protein